MSNQKEKADQNCSSGQPGEIGITDKGKIALLEYEAKGLKRTNMILGLTTVCLALTLIYLTLR